MIRPIKPEPGTFEPSFHCELLCDRWRLEPFKSAIEREVRPGDVVLDIGTGSGILALLAAKTASRVYTVETEREIADRALAAFQESEFSAKFQPIIRKRIQDLDFNDIGEQVDVITCELLETWLLVEHEIPALNRALELDLLRSGGRLLPRRVFNLATPVEGDPDIYRIYRSYYNENAFLPASRELGKPLLVKVINLGAHNPTERIRVVAECQILSGGVVNGIRLESYAELTDDVFVGWTPTLFPRFVIPIAPKAVQPHDAVRFAVSYEHAGSFQEVEAEWL